MSASTGHGGFWLAEEVRIEAIGAGQIVTGIGRELALDRDGNYARVQSADEALVNGKGVVYPGIREEAV